MPPLTAGSETTFQKRKRRERMERGNRKERGTKLRWGRNEREEIKGGWGSGELRKW